MLPRELNKHHNRRADLMYQQNARSDIVHQLINNQMLFYPHYFVGGSRGPYYIGDSFIDETTPPTRHT